MDEAAHAVEILLHPLGIDEQFVDHAGQAGEREIERDGRVGADEALDRGVARCRARARARHSPAPASTAERTMRARPVRFSVSTGLRLCGIAELPFCPGAKYSSASSTSVRCRWRISVASRSIDEAITPSVAKNMAWRSRGMTWVEIGSTLEAQLLRDMRFDRRVDVGEGADRAGNGAGGDLVARRDQPAAVAGELGIGLGELEPEGDRLGMDAVAAADGRGQLVLEGAALQHFEQRVEVLEQEVGRLLQLHRQAVSSTSELVMPW